MFPIGDDNPTRRTSYVTYGLIAINVLVFFYEMKLQNQAVVTGRGEVLGTAMDYCFRDWSVVPRRLTAAIVPLIISNR